MSTNYEDTIAEQDGLEALRVRHVRDAIAQESAGRWNPGQIDRIVGYLDLKQFVRPDGKVDGGRITRLLNTLPPSSARQSGSVALVSAQRRAAREAKSGGAA